MISPSSFHLASREKVSAHLQSSLEQYRRLDNASGDTAPQRDRVELDSGHGKTQAVLDRGFFSSAVTERVQDETGKVTIRQYCKEALHEIGGFEVSRSAAGAYAGSELKFVNGWDSDGFHGYDKMNPADASQQFNLMEAYFIAEFKKA